MGVEGEDLAWLLSDRLDAAREEARKLRIDLAGAQERYNQLGPQLDAARNQIRGLELQAASYEGLLLSAVGQRRAANLERVAAQTEISILQQQLDDVRALKGGEDGEWERLRGEVDMLRGTMTVLFETELLRDVNYANLWEMLRLAKAGMGPG